MIEPTRIHREEARRLRATSAIVLTAAPPADFDGSRRAAVASGAGAVPRLDD